MLIKAILVIIFIKTLRSVFTRLRWFRQSVVCYENSKQDTGEILALKNALLKSETERDSNQADRSDKN